jgi:transcription-repair coupling factor (superfamily II helicase)
LHGLIDQLGREPQVTQAIDWASTRRPTATLTTIASLRPFLAVALAEAADRPLLIVTPTYREAEVTAATLESLTDPAAVALYPAWETLPHERLSPRSDTVGRRLGILRRLVGNDRLPAPRLLVAPIRSIIQPQVAGLGQMSPVTIITGHEYDIHDLSQRLVDAAYIRTDLVTRRGEFAVRGGILDLFTPTDEAPVRVDFFGDEVDEIRPFSVADQRSLDQTLDQVTASPCREMLLTDDVKARAEALLPDHPELADLLDRIAAGHAVEGMEALAPALVEGLELLTDVVPENTLVVVFDPELVRGRAHELVATSQEFLNASWAAAAGGGQAPIDLGASAYRSLGEVRQSALARGLGWWQISPYASAPTDGPDLSQPGTTPAHATVGSNRSPADAPGSGQPSTGTPAPDAVAESSQQLTDAPGSGHPVSSRSVTSPADESQPDQLTTAPTDSNSDSQPEPNSETTLTTTSTTRTPASLTIAADAMESWRGRADEVLTWLRQASQAGEAVVVVAGGHGTATRYRQVLLEAGLPAHQSERVDELIPGRIVVTDGRIEHGFFLPDIKLRLVTVADLTGTQVPDQAIRKLPSRRKKTINPLELTAGDLIVHDQHGVGRYVEITQRTVQGATRDYLVLEYAASKRGHPTDRLYVPMDQLHLVTPYVGGEQPALDKLGGADWSKRKARAKKAVHAIAQELVRLYAARQAAQGFAFSPDSEWQREMENAFNFVETPDQLSCIDDVKRDMERVMPMDRLVCGDVGYGKTEIAVRAAFKAAMDGKQVAVLVPTTLLAQQHFATFSGRFAGFPVTVAALSRFQTPTEERKAIEGLKSGQIDVVIGTHRLLSGDVQFKDLGLVIIDEEQRFGVDHKEKLKQLRLDVDVLAMSATPIPRTLEMAVTGIRELSVIQTPPEERHPVLTFAGVYDEGQVTAAIRRELAREGQVFYVHNRVQTINRVVARVQELVPEARVVVAHGQMSERDLERVMVDFWERRADVLVCTTIVESGLDIQSANTLILDRADAMGLSQLHQLRGRVGRSRERGYAYLFYPPEKPLTETAHDRLATMAAHSELGAGMSIAMRDLEIRGAGNLLGADQSGHIAEVGFDLYLRLVGQAVAEFREEKTEPEPQMRIDLPVDAHLPTDYIDSERLRLEMYKRIAEVRSETDLASVIEELTDRYGDPPPEVLALLAVARFRHVAQQAGITEVVVQGKFIRFGPADLPESRRVRAQRLYPGTILKTAESCLLVPRPMTDGLPRQPVVDQPLLDWASQVVKAVFAPASVQPATA